MHGGYECNRVGAALMLPSQLHLPPGLTEPMEEWATSPLSNLSIGFVG